MTALSADKKRITRNLANMVSAEILLADSQTVYGGAMIMRNSSGDPIVGADTASCTFMGIASEAVTSAGSNTTKKVKIEYGHEEFFAVSSVTKASIGVNVSIVDDATIGLVGATTNDVLVGELVEMETIDGVAGGWVRVRHFV